MRTQLLDPTAGDTRLIEAVALARDIYAHHEVGADYSKSLHRLGQIAGHPIHRFAVHSAFGSVKPESFAKRLLIAWDQLPLDLDRDEMLEMIENICGAKGEEFQIEYWIACLRANTGDEKLSDLIFWPGNYFGDGNQKRNMSPSEILAIALAAGGRH